MIKKLKLRLGEKGGPGSGNWGHAGRPGLVGGSSKRSVHFGPGDAGAWGEDLNAFMDERTPEYGDWRRASHRIRAVVKSQITDELCERTGLDRELVRDFIKQWAHSSNDSDMRSLSIQEAAAEELGVELSDWQKASIEKILDVSWMDEQYSHWPKETLDKAKADYFNRLDRKPLMPREQERQLVRAMYDYTQEELAKAGYKPDDTIEVYRGVTYGDTKPDFGESDVINYKGNAIESWSVGEQVADAFAAGGGELGPIDPMGILDYGATISMNVPVKNIISTAHTGFGCLKEGEVIVAGNVPGSKGFVNTLFEPPTQEEIDEYMNLTGASEVIDYWT